MRGKDVQEIEELKRQGLSIRAISRLIGYDRKTISKYLANPEGVPAYGPREKKPSKLEAFHVYLLQFPCDQTVIRINGFISSSCKARFIMSQVPAHA